MTGGINPNDQIRNGAGGAQNSQQGQAAPPPAKKQPNSVMTGKAQGKNPTNPPETAKKPDKNNPPNSVLSKGAEESGVREFKAYDKDGDLKISEEELLNKYVKEYVDNGYNLVGAHKAGDTIADLLSFLKDRFQKFAGKDNQLNIDEYLGMVKDRLEAQDALRKSKYDAPPAQANNAKISTDAPKRASEIKNKAEKNN